jgi:hypothetical protein
MPSELEKQYWRWFSTVVNTPPNSEVPLVTAYIHLFKGNKDRAIKKLNKLNDTNYTAKRLREWERGVTKIPYPALAAMQVAVINAKFGDVSKELRDLLNIKLVNSPVLLHQKRRKRLD